MRNLTATLCLTLAVLLGSAGVSVSQDFQKGFDAWDRGDFATALREWTPLAEQGHALAQFYLGLGYENGDGVPQDYATAVKWYTLAAERGLAIAETNLGRMYLFGEGVPQDFATAVKWYTLAAEQGHADAQFNLGWMYRHGRGVPQDSKTAVKWYRLAAEQGDAGAQYNLGTMYGAVLLDYVYAHMWWNIAALQGHEGATEYRDTIAERMTPSQIEKAQDLARECVKKNYKGC